MRYLCIHSHCYQPPREDPWIDEVERQDSAWPYHDWNERITAECYRPNTAARILDNDQRILKIVNNYSHISFDFGPTLLAWLEKKAPETYEAIRTADGESSKRFSGHGSAIAHAYNHMIMPLANARDKVTQVRWGIQDFVQRFGRRPEGMWLPETAVDLESLEIMAVHGIKFTVLAPRQARSIRAHGTREWQEASGGRIDPTQPYLLNLPSGGSINLFFYDGPVSQAVSFEELLADGEKFIGRLLSAYARERHRPELVHIVTDGEVYGHHHKQGEMALAYTLQQIESRGLARITNYGEYLDCCPPTYEAQINENTSWSCAHGVDRWRRHCGCNAGKSDWTQEWRAPLREAFDWLRDMMATLYERKAAELLTDPWEARNDYISVVLDRSVDSCRRFKQRQLLRVLEASEETMLWRLLELQRHAMLMYTSCGWFFDEISGIEAVQVIRHAARAVELAEVLFGQDLEPQLLRRLALAKSNIADQRDGARIYEKMKKALGHRDVDVAISKEDYRLCEGLGQLHSVIRQNPLDFVKNVHWPRPRLEEAGSILERVGKARYVEAEAAYGRDRAENGSLLGFLRDMKIPLPTTSASTAERALNSMLRRALTEDNLDEHRIRTLVEDARALGVKLDVLTIQCIEKTVAHLSQRCSAAPENIESLAALNQHIELLSSLGLSLTLWTTQNMCYSFVQSIYPEMKSKGQAGDRHCLAWICQFRMLGEKLALRVPE